MTEVFHLIGLQGSRKTTVAVALACRYAARGSVCMLIDTVGCVTAFDVNERDFVQHRDTTEGANVLFTEHYTHETVQAKPGELLVHFKVAR